MINILHSSRPFRRRKRKRVTPNVQHVHPLVFDSDLPEPVNHVLERSDGMNSYRWIISIESYSVFQENHSVCSFHLLTCDSIHQKKEYLQSVLACFWAWYYTVVRDLRWCHKCLCLAFRSCIIGCTSDIELDFSMKAFILWRWYLQLVYSCVRWRGLPA